MNTRTYWLNTLLKVAEPVLMNLSNKQLREKMVMEAKLSDRDHYSCLEALGRLLAGISPWLEKPCKDKEEEVQRQKFAELARKSIDAITDCDSPDFCMYNRDVLIFGVQTIVDSAYLCHSILRAPNELYHKLDQRVKNNLIKTLKDTRKIRPARNNWLLFSAMIEAGLYLMENDCDMMRVDYALHQHEMWYVGDGLYGDGNRYHWDYYNSYVIQPMMFDIIKLLYPVFREKSSIGAPNKGDIPTVGETWLDNIIKRSQRYCVLLERQISPDGSFPATGRSIVYRTGVFQVLAQLALSEDLPKELTPAQVRCAITKVIKKCLEAEGTFGESGFLQIGLCGHQPDLGELYISTGSLYMCSLAFLPLGLPENHEFWTAPDCKITWEKIWNGENMQPDHFLYEVED